MQKTKLLAKQKKERKKERKRESVCERGRVGEDAVVQRVQTKREGVTMMCDKLGLASNLGYLLVFVHKKKDKLDVHMKKKIPEPTNNCPPRIHFFISYLFFDHCVCIQPTNLTHKSHIYIVFSSSELHLFLQM